MVRQYRTVPCQKAAKQGSNKGTRLWYEGVQGHTEQESKLKLLNCKTYLLLLQAIKVVKNVEGWRKVKKNKGQCIRRRREEIKTCVIFMASQKTKDGSLKEKKKVTGRLFVRVGKLWKHGRRNCVIKPRRANWRWLFSSDPTSLIKMSPSTSPRGLAMKHALCYSQNT